MKKFQFLGKILHSKSLRVINGGSGITKCDRRNCLEQKMPRGVAWRRAWAQAGDSQGGTQEKGGARVSVRRGGVGCGPGEGDP